MPSGLASGLIYQRPINLNPVAGLQLVLLRLIEHTPKDTNAIVIAQLRVIFERSGQAYCGQSIAAGWQLELINALLIGECERDFNCQRVHKSDLAFTDLAAGRVQAVGLLDKGAEHIGKQRIEFAAQRPI